jgi:hypothetical protein
MHLASSKRIPLFGKVCAAVGVCCLINFGIWGYFDIKQGGNALNGTVEDGRYFFSEHGVRSEVPADVWKFSKAYTKVTIVAFVVGGISLFIFGSYANQAGEKNVEPGAAPNGGPAKRLDRSGATEGPPSVS